MPGRSPIAGCQLYVSSAARINELAFKQAEDLGVTHLGAPILLTVQSLVDNPDAEK